MGDGLAIEPSGTVVKAPADCDVSVVMADTGHACGLTLANGIELLIHVGVDTVDMNGDGFELLVQEGQTCESRSGTDQIRSGKDQSSRTSLHHHADCNMQKEMPPSITYAHRNRRKSRRNSGYHLGLNRRGFSKAS